MIEPPFRPWLSMLAVRFGAILALALLPIGVVTYLQSHTLENEVRARAEAGLLGTTLRVAAEQTSMIREAQGMMASTAQAVLLVLDDPAKCNSLMRQVAGVNPKATVVGFVPNDGIMRCSSVGKPLDFSANANFKFFRDAHVPSFRVSAVGAVSGQSVLAISHPVTDDTGVFIGYVVISLPHAALTDLRPRTGEVAESEQQPLYFWSFDDQGELTAGSIDLEMAATRRPATRSLASFVGQPAQVFEDLSRAGMQRTYAVVPVVENQLYLMSSWRNTDNSLVQQFRLTSFLSPLLMWFVGLVAAAVGAERMVTRHIRTLNQAISSFARGDRRLETIDLRGAPIELRLLGDAYLSMTETITRGEAAMEDSVHQKEVLLREVHHRVKNNLQLIASIMNLQMRKTASAEAKVLLRDLHDRVMSLATIHRGLYQTSGMADVNAEELLPEIVRQITGLTAGTDRKVDVGLEVQDMRLVPDQAVPLLLLLTEALTNAIKHSSRPAQIWVRFVRKSPTEAVLSVENTLTEERAEDPPKTTTDIDDGLGLQLITAFSHQLGGKLDIDTTGKTYSVRVTFSPSPLTTAEHRSDTSPSE